MPLMVTFFNVRKGRASMFRQGMKRFFHSHALNDAHQ